MAQGRVHLRTALDAFGQVDILICNAGILRDRTFASEKDWDLDVNQPEGTYCCRCRSGKQLPRRHTPTLEGGWETLAHIGYFDADGCPYLTDGRTDMVLVGGASVYPAEVEAVIDEHQLVMSNAVLGLLHEDIGSSVHAIVQARRGPVDRGAADASGRADGD
ncbi:acyl-CoA synthetase (AMP-forming)/AMP-acid ligase II [Bradyrhizobium sp. RT6a]|uniref:hypothetical protein n=1 Tax=Bradyrhizobium sp. RT6a TaxID=3156381 RepID=UPI0033943EB0